MSCPGDVPEPSGVAVGKGSDGTSASSDLMHDAVEGIIVPDRTVGLRGEWEVLKGIRDVALREVGGRA